MPNIKQQKKRMHLAERQRASNRKAKSTIKTLMRTFDDQVAAGDREAAEATLRTIDKAVDQAVAKGVLHRNAGARKKSAAARRLSALS